MSQKLLRSQTKEGTVRMKTRSWIQKVFWKQHKQDLTREQLLQKDPAVNAVQSLGELGVCVMIPLNEMANAGSKTGLGCEKPVEHGTDGKFWESHQIHVCGEMEVKKMSLNCICNTLFLLLKKVT